jgi:hypothetical protein
MLYDVKDAATDDRPAKLVNVFEGAAAGVKVELSSAAEAQPPARHNAEVPAKY